MPSTSTFIAAGSWSALTQPEKRNPPSQRTEPGPSVWIARRGWTLERDDRADGGAEICQPRRRHGAAVDNARVKRNGKPIKAIAQRLLGKFVNIGVGADDANDIAVNTDLDGETLVEIGRVDRVSGKSPLPYPRERRLQLVLR